MLEIKEVSDVTLAFPANVIRDGLLPAWDDIPERFKTLDRDGWIDLFVALFYEGGKAGHDLWLHPNPGVDGAKAFRQIRACLGSYEPRHEHKTAGVTFMLSEWFESYDWQSHDRADTRSKFFFKGEVPNAVSNAV